jgi:hypothetical protein
VKNLMMMMMMMIRALSSHIFISAQQRLIIKAEISCTLTITYCKKKKQFWHVSYYSLIRTTETQDTVFCVITPCSLCHLINEKQHFTLTSDCLHSLALTKKTAGSTRTVVLTMTLHIIAIQKTAIWIFTNSKTLKPVGNQHYDVYTKIRVYSR